MKYVEKVLAEVKAKNPNEREFHQAATEILTSLEPVVSRHPRHAEQDHAFGLDEALQKRGALVFGVARNNGFEAR